MASSRAVARSLRKSADRLSKVRRPLVAEAATSAIELAANRGGTLYGGRARLYAEVVAKKDTAKRSMVLVYPKPAGAWSIKSFGRSQSEGSPVLAIEGVGFRPRARPTKGDQRWPRIQDQVEEMFGDMADEAVADAIQE